VAWRHPAASRKTNWWRILAAILLVIEALWSASNVLAFGFAGSTNATFAIVALILTFLPLLAVFFLFNAPHAGVRLSVGLQLVVGIEGFVMLFLMTSIFGAVVLVLAIATALSLGQADAGSSRR